MPVTIQVKGLDPVLRKLDKLKQMQAVKDGLRKGADEIKKIWSEYPPETIANSPNNPRGYWYERGYGFRWKLRGGGIGGKKTSEKLGTHWAIEESHGGMTLSVRNYPVTYNIYVHEKRRQAYFHKKTGWKADEDVARSEVSKIVQYANAEIAKVIVS